MRKRVLLALVCALALVGLTAGSASAGGPVGEPLQPYWVWDQLDAPFGPVPVLLSDQFNDLSVSVDSRDYIMNPVFKEGIIPPTPLKGMVDPNLHYTWNRINPPPKPGATQVRNVRIFDQFGVNVWTIRRKPTYLLTPTDKCIQPCANNPPPPNQHYACYEAVKSPFIGDIVELSDQFLPGDLNVVGLGQWVCAPVDKTEGANNFPILAEGLHLSCYDVDSTFSPVPWQALDQFGPFGGAGQTDAFLCVNANKELPLSQVPSMGSWALATLAGLMGLLTMVWYARRRTRGGLPA